MSKKTDILLSGIRKCTDKYGLIDENDRVLCAVSGGKDSLCLLYGLKKLSLFYPKKFEVCAVLVDMGFEGTDFSPVKNFADKLEVPFEIIKTDIKSAVSALDKPCSLCARMRRAALCDYAHKNGFTKLALGHTEDDTAQTALMNLLYNGKIYTLEPKFRYEDKDLSIIRPLMTTNERLIIRLAAELDLPIIKNPCGKEQDSARDQIRKIIKETDRICRGTAHRVASAYTGDGDI